jgi:hypothetical protein
MECTRKRYTDGKGVSRHLEADDTVCVGAGKVLQLIPADGWRAQFSTSDGTTFLRPLISWALVRDCDRERRVAGVVIEDGTDPTIVSPTSDRTFIAFLGPGQEPDEPNQDD